MWWLQLRTERRNLQALSGARNSVQSTWLDLTSLKSQYHQLRLKRLNWLYCLCRVTLPVPIPEYASWTSIGWFKSSAKFLEYVAANSESWINFFALKLDHRISSSKEDGPWGKFICWTCQGADVRLNGRKCKLVKTLLQHHNNKNYNRPFFGPSMWLQILLVQYRSLHPIQLSNIH